jgi:hypothetical protein
MLSVDAFKPYKARIGALLAILKLRLAEVPNLEALTKSLASGSVSVVRTPKAGDEAPDPRAYRINLEGGRSIWATGFLYRYDTEDGTGFSRVQARSIQSGNLVFDMSDELRDEVEDALGLRNDAGFVAGSPHHKILAIYHREVSERVREFFPLSTRQAAVRAIKAKMLTLDKAASEISDSQIHYWVNLDAAQGTPHGARAQSDFQLFCRSLGMEPATADLYWLAVRTARKDNQGYGRYLAGCYAEIVFAPESAQAYRGISPDVVERFQSEALHCLFRVISVESPSLPTPLDKPLK